jgi:hypothetical protein
MSLGKADRVGKIHKNKGGLFIQTNEINGCRAAAIRQDEHRDRYRGTGHETAIPLRQVPQVKLRLPRFL